MGRWQTLAGSHRYPCGKIEPDICSTGKGSNAVKFYFESCKEQVNEAINHLTAQSTLTKEVFFEKVLTMLLIDGKSNDQILMFQEIWTLSARNKELQKAVETYYKTYCLWLIDLVSMFSKDPDTIVSLLVPFVEGYTIVNNVIPLDRKRTIQMMVKLISNMEE